MLLREVGQQWSPFLCLKAIVWCVRVLIANYRLFMSSCVVSVCYSQHSVHLFLILTLPKRLSAPFGLVAFVFSLQMSLFQSPYNRYLFNMGLNLWPKKPLKILDQNHPVTLKRKKKKGKNRVFFCPHNIISVWNVLNQAKLESYYNKCYNWIRLTFLSGARNALITRGGKWISNEYFFWWMTASIRSFCHV